MDDPLRIASTGAPAIIAIFTLPVVWRFADRIRHGKTIKNDDIYEDKDGAANEESMARYSTKRSFLAIFVALALGLAASLALVVIAMVYHFHETTQIWLLFWSWVCKHLTIRLHFANKFRFLVFFKFSTPSVNPRLSPEPNGE